MRRSCLSRRDVSAGSLREFPAFQERAVSSVFAPIPAVPFRPASMARQPLLSHRLGSHDVVTSVVRRTGPKWISTRIYSEIIVHRHAGCRVGGRNVDGTIAVIAIAIAGVH